MACNPYLAYKEQLEMKNLFPGKRVLYLQSIEELQGEFDIIACPNPMMKFQLSQENQLKFRLVPFPLNMDFKNFKSWDSREDAFYYHGRIIPEKVRLNFVENMLKDGFKVILQGPLLKHYWVEENLEGAEFEYFRVHLKRLVDEYSNLNIKKQITSSAEMVLNLNKYKYYFTSSSGEFYNVALQEAIQCGCVPFAATPGQLEKTYWFAKDLYIGFKDYEDFKEKSCFLNKKNEEILKVFSIYISNEIARRPYFSKLC